MNALSRFTLLAAVSALALFCQTGPSPDPQQWSSARDIATASATSETMDHFTCGTYNHAKLAPGTLLPLNHCFATPDAPAPATLTPFSYTIDSDRVDYFRVKVGPLRYTVSPRNSQFGKPAGGRLQSLVDGILRHYTSNPVVPVNPACLRSLSCNSLYVQALQRRSASSTTR